MIVKAIKEALFRRKEKIIEDDKDEADRGHDMFVIVGLGNPGKKYENTRHNIGFTVLDRLEEKYGIKICKIKHKALLGEGKISGKKVLLVKPQTYMNLSGNAVREIMNYYKVDTTNLLVIYDDIDIPAGDVRIRMKGSAGTHNGMKSIIYDIQDDDFPRIRIGIGGAVKSELKDFVLAGFNSEEKKLLEAAVNHSVDSIEYYLENGIEKTMNKYNLKRASGEKKDNAGE